MTRLLPHIGDDRRVRFWLGRDYVHLHLKALCKPGDVGDPSFRHVLRFRHKNKSILARIGPLCFPFTFELGAVSGED